MKETIDTNCLFEKGKLTVLLDGGAGSSGKGKLAAYAVKHSDNLDFVCNTFSCNASHTVVEGNKTYIYKNLNSCAHEHEKFSKMYLGHGSVINLKSLLEEIKFSGIPKEKLGIDPLAMIAQDIDSGYESGDLDFHGNPLETMGDGTVKTGTTASGSGCAKARKVLRDKNLKIARDVPELKEYLCNVGMEITERLLSGESGFLEIAQGYQLSYGLAEHYPYTTSRNCTVAAGFDDLMVSPAFLGNVLLNFRTFPIRIHSYKYIHKSFFGNDMFDAPDDHDKLFELYSKHLNFKPDKIQLINEGTKDVELTVIKDGKPVLKAMNNGVHLTWDQVQSGLYDYEKIESFSGNWYDDQEELDWDYITKSANSDVPILECTTLTKLPRRVATFSKKNLLNAIKHNHTNGKVFVSVNFANYVDSNIAGKKGYFSGTNDVTEKFDEWVKEYIFPVIRDEAPLDNVHFGFIGTGADTDEMLFSRPLFQ